MKFFIIIKDKSERVKNKNFIDLGGLPLWKHLINELSGEDVFIDTDSKKIIDECEDIDWVTCYSRDNLHVELETSNEFVVSPVLLMIENFLDKYVDDDEEIIITPHVTSPFIKKETIKDASKLLNDGYDSVLACTEHQEFCYFDDKPVNFDPNVVQKTQDLKSVKMGNGAFFIFTKKTFKENKNRVGKNPYYYPLDFKESIEIDNYEDYEISKKFI
jgi:N-acylneuraminate cytidylyltransferase